MNPWSKICFSGEMIFSCRAAEAMKGLIVEPEAYWPETTRLKRGLAGSLNIFWKVSVDIPWEKRLLSKLGQETRARTPPVLGSMATAAPFRLPISSTTRANSVWSFFCRSASSQRTKLWPALAVDLIRSWLFSPAAFFWISKTPGWPRKTSS